MSDQPQVIMVQPEDYAGVAQTLAFIGQQLADAHLRRDRTGDGP